MADGLSYVRRNRLVLGAITLDLFAVLLGGVTAMLPVYARDILQVGADGLGPLRAAPAVGATLTAIFFSVRPLKTDVGVKMLAAVVVFGAATAVFGFSTSYPLSLAMLALLGAADMFSVYIRQSLIQLHTPDEMRGRVARRLDAGDFRLQRARRDPQRLHRRLARPGRGDRRRRHRSDRRSPCSGPACSPSCAVPAPSSFPRNRRPRKRPSSPAAPDLQVPSVDPN